MGNRYGTWMVAGLLCGALGCSDGDGNAGAPNGAEASGPNEDAKQESSAAEKDPTEGAGDASEEENSTGMEMPDGFNSGETGSEAVGDGIDAGGTGGAGGGGGTGGAGPAPNFIPTFPGAPASEAGQPLQGGMLCDSVPGATIETVSNVTRCFFGEEQTVEPAVTIEQVLECVDGQQTVHLRLTFDPGFNDNTYGAGSQGWPSPVRGHRFRDLVGSDHAELVLVDGDGEVAMQFKLDYISEDSSAPSGYATQCHEGGDGEISKGSGEHIVDCATSLDKNLNERGYSQYTEDSPITDANFSVNPDAPEWDYRIVFEVWVDVEAFGDAGFAGAFIDYVHASPAKTPDDTIEVTPGECPPCEEGCDENPPAPGDPSDPDCYDGDPDTTCDDRPGDPCWDDDPDTTCNPGTPGEPSDPDCYDGDPDTTCDDRPGDPCWDDDPDTTCNDGTPGTTEPDPDPEPEPAYCDLYPTDVACNPI